MRLQRLYEWFTGRRAMYQWRTQTVSKANTFTVRKLFKYLKINSLLFWHGFEHIYAGRKIMLWTGF
jgi:hypothetical protein